ncbi:hypothetical protein Tco_1254511 [Tanacetum coccineum]
MKTPMSSDTKLMKDEECESVDSTKYRGMIGTTHLGLWYPKGTGIETIVYADSDHAGDYVDQKSTSDRHIHEGRGVDPNFDDMVYLNSIFGMIGFNYLLTISEQIVPRIILEFYSQFRLDYNSEGQMLVKFIIQNKLLSLTLKEFGRILRIPIEGQRSFSDKWSLDNLELSVPSSGLYQTTPPTPDEIKLYVQVERGEPLTCIGHSQTIDVDENQILTREITPIIKSWVKIICENVFCLGGNRDNTQKDYGTKRGCPSTSAYSSSAFDHPSSSHHIDDDYDKNDEEDDETHTPSPIAKSSSPSPPNAPSKTPSTKDTSSTFGTTSSSFESKPCSLPFSSRNTPSPQPTNLFLDDPLDAPPRPSNPLPLQSNPSLDITLSLSPITPLDNMFETPSPPSPLHHLNHLSWAIPSTSIFLTIMEHIIYVASTIEISSFLLGMKCISCFLTLNIFLLPTSPHLLYLIIKHL